MKKIILLNIIIVLILLGCATPKTFWLHPTKTAQEYSRDEARCEAMAYSVGYPLSSGDVWGDIAIEIGRQENWKRIYINCMKGEGWRLMSVGPGK